MHALDIYLFLYYKTKLSGKSTADASFMEGVPTLSHLHRVFLTEHTFYQTI